MFLLSLRSRVNITFSCKNREKRHHLHPNQYTHNKQFNCQFNSDPHIWSTCFKLFFFNSCLHSRNEWEESFDCDNVHDDNLSIHSNDGHLTWHHHHYHDCVPNGLQSVCDTFSLPYCYHEETHSFTQSVKKKPYQTSPLS